MVQCTDGGHCRRKVKASTQKVVAKWAMDLSRAESGVVYIVMRLGGHGKRESANDGGDLD